MQESEEDPTMKRVMAVIKPFKADDVKEALAQAGVMGMTLTEVRGMGRQKGHTELYRGAEYAASFIPKLELEFVIPDELLEKATRALLDSAQTGAIGDGKIFVTPVDQAYRIRTGESGDSALT
jgi:nitrogen regulatory protein PII